MKKFLSVMISFTLVTSILASGAAVSSAEGVVTALPKIDSTAWQYNSDDNVYYQTGISYCENPADTAYETLAVFVPGTYMNAADNGDGTYTCEINTEAVVGNYTADTAPHCHADQHAGLFCYGCVNGLLQLHGIY